MPTIVKEELGNQIREALALAAVPPQQRKQKPIPRWTLKRFVQWIIHQWKINCCRETVRRSWKKLGFSGKKAKKLLNKGNTPKRDELVEKITGLLNDAMHQKRLLIYEADLFEIAYGSKNTSILKKKNYGFQLDGT